MNDKCDSLWFQRFIASFQVRMGVIWKPNPALSVIMLLDVIKDGKQKFENDTDKDEEHH